MADPEAGTSLRRVTTPLLEIAYEEHGPPDGDAVILLHGFPYDPRCYDAVAASLSADGYRAVVPYLRGYGPTRFSFGRDQALRPAGGAGARSA